MARFEHISPLEKRLKELEKEKSLLQRDMKALSRAVQKGTDDELPPLQSDAYRREQPVQQPETAPVHDPRKTLEKMVGQDASRDEKSFPQAPKVKSSVAYDTWVTARPVAQKAVAGNERFASYFSSGSFGKGRPMTQERRLQRNKAIFMLFFVLLIGFIIFRAIF